MALCAICGKPVICEHVMHGKCWEEKLARTRERICDEACRWPHLCSSESALEKHCAVCALTKLTEELK